MFELPRTLIRGVLEFHVNLFGVEPDSHVNLFGVCLNPTYTYSETELRAAQPRRDPRDARRLAPRCGGRLVYRAVAPFRVVKMRRRSFTPRFASKTIRSLAHFHSAGDGGMTLVGIWRAFAPALASCGAPPECRATP